MSGCITEVSHAFHIFLRVIMSGFVDISGVGFFYSRLLRYLFPLLFNSASGKLNGKF